MKSRIKVGFWNIEGYLSSIDDPLCVSNLTKLDIVGLCETWLGHQSKVCVPHGYSHFSLCRKKDKTTKRSYGGVLLLFKSELENHISLQKCETPETIFVKVDRVATKLSKDLYICITYIPPKNSQFLKRQPYDHFDLLEKEIAKFKKRGHVLLGGDYNSRTGQLTDYIIDDSVDDFIPLPAYYNKDSRMPRSNEDLQFNSHGRSFCDMLKSSGLRILNGRVTGDLLGAPTCYNYTGFSTVDYIIADEELFNSVEYLYVHPLLPVSKHCLISCELSHKPGYNSPKLQNNIRPSQLYPPVEPFNIKYVPQSDNCVPNTDTQVILDQLLSDIQECNTPNQMLELAYDQLHNICKQLMKTVNVRPKADDKPSKTCKKQRTNKPWFDKDCFALRKKVLTWAKIRVKYPRNNQLSERYNLLATEYRRLLKSKKRDHTINEANKLSELSKNQRQFWKYLKKTNQTTSGHSNNNPIAIDEWAQYFKNLTLNDTNLTTRETLNTIKNKRPSGIDPLNNEITEEEIKKALKKLKPNKAHGPDIIPSDIFKILGDKIVPCLKLLFNSVLDSGEFPHQWNTSFVIPIHKKGPKDVMDNYRCLSVGSSMGKIFNSILNERIICHLDENSLLSETQNGFRNGCRTSDNIFILKTLSDKYLNSKGKKLYSCFVDFSKAFDTVPRDLLLKKINENMNIDGKILCILQSMYSSTSAKVKLSNEVSHPFDTQKGLKQGCVLSPTLFNIYLADLPQFLHENGGAPVCLQTNGDFMCLIYADDVVLLAASEADLQQSLSALEKYSKHWGLNVNIKKTAALTFNKANKLIKNQFTYKNEIIQSVKTFKYLGLILSANGKFTAAIKDLYQRASKAYFGLIHNLDFKLSDNPLVSLQLFDSLIKPILLYCSELWGFENNDKSQIEKLHIKFCKHTLGVSKFCSNIASKAAILPQKWN
jgi:hypothetical protein